MASLSAGMTAEAEVLDAYLDFGLPPAAVREWAPTASRWSTSRRLALVCLLQSDVRWAEYVVRLAACDGRANEAAGRDFFRRNAIAWEETRETRTNQYDIRSIVLSLTLSKEDRAVLEMRLRTDALARGRPD
jgi:hypothetical protein